MNDTTRTRVPQAADHKTGAPPSRRPPSPPGSGDTPSTPQTAAKGDDGRMSTPADKP